MRELPAVLLILPVWILSRILRRDLLTVVRTLPVWILSVILRRDRLSVLWIMPIRILSVILGWILLVRLCRIWSLRNVSGAVRIRISSLCFLVHIFIFR